MEIFPKLTEVRQTSSVSQVELLILPITASFKDIERHSASVEGFIWTASISPFSMSRENVSKRPEALRASTY